MDDPACQVGTVSPGLDVQTYFPPVGSIMLLRYACAPTSEDN